jgi:hypothetical protein
MVTPELRVRKLRLAVVAQVGGRLRLSAMDGGGARGMEAEDADVVTLTRLFSRVFKSRHDGSRTQGSQLHMLYMKGEHVGTNFLGFVFLEEHTCVCGHEFIP